MAPIGAGTSVPLACLLLFFCAAQVAGVGGSVADRNDLRRFRAYRSSLGQAISSATSHQKELSHAYLPPDPNGFPGPGRMRRDGPGSDDHHDLHPGNDNDEHLCDPSAGPTLYGANQLQYDVYDRHACLCGAVHHDHNVCKPGAWLLCQPGAWLYGTLQHHHHVQHSGTDLHGAEQHHDSGSHAIAAPPAGRTARIVFGLFGLDGGHVVPACVRKKLGSVMTIATNGAKLWDGAVISAGGGRPDRAGPSGRVRTTVAIVSRDATCDWISASPTAILAA